MANPTQPEGPIKQVASLTPAKPLPAAEEAAQPQPSEEKIIPPKEYSSVNGGIKVVIDGDNVSIDFIGKIAEDVGCYRNIKSLRVQFQEGQGPSIIPMV